MLFFFSFVGFSTQADVVEVARKASDRSVDVDAVLNATRDFPVESGVQLVMLASPNNPTGVLTPLTAIRRLCAELPPNALLVVDEAYIEFVNADHATSPSASIGINDASAVSLLDEFDNLFVTRTLSKWAGIAALVSARAFERVVPLSADVNLHSALATDSRVLSS